MPATGAAYGGSEPARSARPSQPFFWERFNLALFAFHALMGLLNFAMSGKAHEVPWTGIFLSTALDLVRYLVFLLITAYFVAVFWRQLVASVAAVRPISFQEAVAVVLMVGILFGS